MSYWLAPALDTMRAELNRDAPRRDKASDGWIGDRAHASRDSDHNPANHPRAWTGVVRAYDIDADLNNGRSTQWLADRLASMLGKHPALMSGAYIIYNRRIISTDRLREGWRYYGGANAHQSHIHVSVSKAASGYNSTAPWNLFSGSVQKEDDEMSWDEKLSKWHPGDTNKDDTMRAGQTLGQARGYALVAYREARQANARTIRIEKQNRAILAALAAVSDLPAEVAVAVREALAEAVVDVNINVSGGDEG